MNTYSRIAVLAVSLLSLLAALSSTAGAVTWTNTGQTAFTATAGPSTLSAGGVSLACTSGDAGGVAPMSTTGTVASTIHGTFVLTGCTLAGLSAGVHCTYTYTSASFVSPVTSGSLDFTCRVYVGNGTQICHMEGELTSTYTNGAAGVLAIPHTSSGITITDAPPHRCPVRAHASTTLTALTFRVTSGTGPVFARDA